MAADLSVFLVQLLKAGVERPSRSGLIDLPRSLGEYTELSAIEVR
jgi:hypothetical protein